MTNKSVAGRLLSAAICAAMLLCGQWAAAQVDPAPGFENPQSFETGEINFYWEAQVGIKMSVAPDASQGITGSCFTLTPADSCLEPGYSPGSYTTIRPKHPGLFRGDDIETLDSVFNSTWSQFYVGDTSLQMKPRNHFAIVHYNDSRTPDIDSTVGMDPYTQYKLPLCPPGATSAIRIGNLGSDTESDALYYTMQVNPDNALLIINYACVIEDPGSGGHGPKYDPNFIIRVTRQLPDGTWSQISDTMCYMQPSTACSNSDAIPGQCINVDSAGWHHCRYPSGSGWGGGNVYWKEWSRVAVSLNNYLFQTVRVEIYVGDCAYSAHFGYGYVAGTAQPMALTGKGCPVGESTAVDTLTAPAGLSNYIFYKQVSGPTQVSVYDQKLVDSSGFDFLTTVDEATGQRSRWQRINRSPIANTSNTFPLEQEDFLETNGTYAGSKNFMCKMRSFMDPTKPITSMVFTQINYNKPVIQLDSVLSCDRTIKLINKSYSPNLNMDADSTYWLTYDNPDCVGIPLDTLRGDTVNPRFDHGGMNGIYLFAKALTSDGTRCYSEKHIPMKILEQPRARIQIAGRELCDNQQAQIEDRTYPGHEDSVYRRVWGFEGVDTLVFNHYTITFDTTTGTYDTVENTVDDHLQTLRRGFDQRVVPVWLDVYNGYYYVVEGDTTWCHDEARDTIRVFIKPNIQPEGDSVVCKGTRTDMTVRVVDADTAEHTYRYQWSLTDRTVTGNLPAGNRLRIEPTHDTTTYYVQVKNEKNCEAWASARAFLVSPRITMLPADGRICPDSVAVIFGSKADHYSWTSSPVDASLGGQQNADTIRVSPTKTTTYTMTGHGANNCNATPLTKTVTIVPLPTISVQTEPGIIDSEDPTVTFRDASAGRASTVWDFGDGTAPVSGEEVTYTYGETYVDTMFVTMTSFNDLGCPSKTTFPLPVVQFTAWTPNIFTPAIETNNRFSFYTINEYEYFTIYIYDRRGRLVYQSDDVHFEWDGRDLNGTECPQGAYVWVMRYRRPGTSDLVTRKGSVTVLR